MNTQIKQKGFEIGASVVLKRTVVRAKLDGSFLIVAEGSRGTITEIRLPGIYRCDFAGAPGFIVPRYLLKEA